MGKSIISHALVLAALASASCAKPSEPVPWQTYEAPSGLFHMTQPRGWTALAHEDGAGVTFVSPSEVAGREVSIDVTLMPPELLPALFVEVPPQADADTLAQVLLSVLTTADGQPLPEPQRLETPAGQAWVVWSPLADRRGAFVVLPTAAGTIITSTILVGEEVANAEVEDHVTEIVGSLQLDVEPEQVLGTLPLPPIYPL